MARFLRSAARLLVTAGSLSFVPLALANTPYVPPADNTPTASSSGVHLVGALHVSQSQAQLEAMKVEMAWLADRVTYQLHLEVEIKGEGLEIRGHAPDEASHQRALEVARQGCYLPVTDAIQVIPNGPIATPTSESITKVARESLARQFGVRSSEFDVKITRLGQIILRGQVGSVEEKLTASRCLRGQQGATAIINCLGVTPIRHAGHTITLVTTDGRHAVHGIVSLAAQVPDDDVASPAVEPPARVPANSSSSMTAPYSPVPAPPMTLTLPSGLPQAQSTASSLPPLPAVSASTIPTLPLRSIPTSPSPASVPTPPTPSTATTSSVDLPAATSPPPAPVLPAAPEPISTQTTIQPVSSMPSFVAPSQTVPPAGYATPMPSFLQPMSVQSLPSYPTCTSCTKGMQMAVVPPTPQQPVSQPSLWERLTSFVNHKPKETTVIVATPPASTAKLAAAPMPAPVVKQPVTQTAAAPAASSATRTSTTTAWPPAYRGQPTASFPDNSDPFKTQTLQVRRPSPPPTAELAPLPPAVQTTSPAPSPVIRVSASTSTTQTTPPVVSALAATQPVKTPPPVGRTAVPGPMGAVVSPVALRRAVQKGCGKLAREVRVEKGKEGQLMVFVVGHRESEQQLIASLLALPEIASTSVRLEIHVSH